MLPAAELALNLATALAAGLLIRSGAERRNATEQRAKGDGLREKRSTA